MAQQRTIEDITAAPTSLELYGGWVGVLRWRTSPGEEAFLKESDSRFGIPEPTFETRDAVGRVLPWSPRGGRAGDGESDGEIEILDLPEAEG